MAMAAPTPPAQDWTDIAAKAQTKTINSIPRDWRISSSKLPPDDQLDVTTFPAQSGLLSREELAITESSATDIVGNLAAGEWTAVEVTTAFCKRAAIAHQVRARELDEIFARTGKTVGPLHGLPVSLKDNFNVLGKPSSVGFCAWALEPMKEESTIVAVLRELGAVAYVKTNVPTAMMIAETVNNCYGRTVNPLNRALTSGGSSGGESALIAMCGSPLGVGTDIGGSLRIPAACTGIFTLKPSYGRLPHFDARSGLAGQEAVASVHGPMARSLSDIRLWAESVVSAEPWKRDPKCIELPWRDIQLKSKLKIGVLWDNGVCRPTPPVSRALRQTVRVLASKGHETVEWAATDHAEAVGLLADFFVADGGTSIQNILDPVHEPWRPELAAYEAAKDKGVHNLWQLQKRRTALQKRYLDRWAAAGIDAVLCPTTPYAAPKNGQFRPVSYTGVFNILDYSAASFPTGYRADKDVDVVPQDFQPLSSEDELTAKEYDGAAVHGMPISLQLVGKRLEEEKVLAMLERIMNDLQT
nr:acetamidase [Quercus suber]